MSRKRFQGGDYPPAKRRRYAVEPQALEVEDGLESLLVRVGEKSSSSLERNLETLVGLLEQDLEAYKAKIIQILLDCIIRMPEKSSIYATLIGLINIKNYSFGGEVVEALVRQLKDAMKACEWEKGRYTFRFICDLGNTRVLALSSVVQLMDSFVQSGSENDVPQVRKDWFIFTVLGSLPFVGKALFEKRSGDLDRILSMIQSTLEKRKKTHVGGLRVWLSDDPHPQEEYLDCLWAQIVKLKGDGWVEKHLPHPYMSFHSVLSEGVTHNLPTIIPPPHHADHSAAQLLLFPYQGGGKVPLEYMVVEVIISELLGLPSSRYLEVFYGSLLIELCTLQPSTIPQVLAQATEMIFSRIETMNVDCIQRFSSWFAYHLSNYQFRWSWGEWQDCLSLDSLHPKPVFIQETLAKCLRLAYLQRLVEVTPESFAPLHPPKAEPVYKYTQESASSLPGTTAAHNLLAAIKQKCTPDEALKVLEDLPNPLTVDGSGDPPYHPLQIEVFTQTLLYLGSKTFSHSFAAITKFHPVLKTLIQTEDAQICLLKNLHQVWLKHPQMQLVLIDKLLKTQIIECAAVANWIFSRDMAPEFTRMYVWEILHMTISKMSKYVKKLSQEVAETKEKLKKLGEESEESDKEGEPGDQRPTEDALEKLEEKLESALADQKNLFLIVFQRFIMILSEHIVHCDTDGKDFHTWWYFWTLGHLKQVFMLHEEQVNKCKDTLETLLFTPELDSNILEVSDMDLCILYFLLPLLLASAWGQKRVVCYWGTWSIYRPNQGMFDLEHFRTELCTHVVYSFLGIEEESLLLTSIDPNADHNQCDGGEKDLIRGLVRRRDETGGFAVMLGIGGWNEASPKWTRMVETAESRKKFIHSAIRTVLTFDADGVDLDWEYPGLRGGRPVDKANFLQFVKELSAALKSIPRPEGKESLILSMAVPPTQALLDPGFDFTTSGDNLATHVDFLNVMAYDYYTCDPRLESCLIGPQAALYEGPGDPPENVKFNVESTVEMYTGLGVPANKLVLGIPFSARTYKHSAETPEWYMEVQDAGAAGPYCTQAGSYCYAEVCETLEDNQWTADMDLFRSVPFAYTTDTFMSYENIESVSSKGDLREGTITCTTANRDIARVRLATLSPLTHDALLSSPHRCPEWICQLQRPKGNWEGLEAFHRYLCRATRMRIEGRATRVEE
ncbi:unnamed protein product [Darwinula stevensoni]|uniref:Nuclear cap-binding protein subunit 1 n=1 Tax=Darwinula stevensoni TaxID=69355 RepID=A0A7R9AAD2_9CRUS|nr:unnamed protein product [Darwinula stevensoni]CAG0898321.1 unnamed protein product [Darwinula stevensoni]